MVHAKTEKYPDTYQDYRRVLDRNDIDGVIIATPDHWHALLTIHTCQAWKDAYVEKPVSTTVVEGRAMVNAARRFGRIVQVGTQQRSLELFKDAVGIVQSGKLGQITTAGAWVGVNEFSGKETPGPPPETLDWDLWLGPAPKVPYSHERFGGFRAFHDYANGELTNWGVHLLDTVQWGIGQDSPLNVQATGVTFTRSNGADDYQTIAGLLEYKGCIVSWEQRHSNEMSGKSYGMKFLGTKGRLFMDRASFIVQPETLAIPETKETGDAWIDVRSHHENFFDCIRSRKRPAADIEQAHKATVASLITAIALDCGRKLVWDATAEKFIGDEQANRHLYRPYRAPWHL
jgi:predicted dehydrogenase